MTLKTDIKRVTDRIIERSKTSRAAYLARMEAQIKKGPHRDVLSCGNLAHGFAACGTDDKKKLSGKTAANIGIVTAYNDMLSAHHPLADYPAWVKDECSKQGAVAQVAGGVPAMCDGVTQGQPGMELSLFSRDNIAQAAAVGLSHNMFDAAIYMGVCDKIVPGLLISALTFGHLPAVFCPAGPMTSGLPNKEKQRVREDYAQGKIGKDELLESESKSYHSAGTCTFYGTANSNQALVEVMGLHVPDTAFWNPGTDLREALTRETARMAINISGLSDNFKPVCRVIDERSIVNAVVMLLATGGSTNHIIHWVAVARAAGIQLTWDDMDELSNAVPLLTRVYPNGQADVNHMHEAGGLPFLIRELCEAGYLHADVVTNAGGMKELQQRASLGEDHAIAYEPINTVSGDEDVVRPADKPFSEDGGLRVLKGNLGISTMKVSAVEKDRWTIEAPAAVYHSQDEVMAAFEAGELHRDVVIVLRFQGPKACGMPELHKLTSPMGVLQKLGYKIAFVTDGRMSGASGKVPAAIHVTPEALDGGPIAKIQNGDMMKVDATGRVLSVLVDEAEFQARPLVEPRELTEYNFGLGRELFEPFRRVVGPADKGASIFG